VDTIIKPVSKNKIILGYGNEFKMFKYCHTLVTMSPSVL